MTWPFPNIQVAASQSGTYAGADDLYTGTATFAAQPAGRTLVAFVQIRRPMVDVTPGWSTLAIDRNLSNSEETDVGIFAKISTGVETSFSVSGAHAEAVDGWAIIVLALTGAGVIAGPSETDPGAPTTSLSAAAITAPAANTGLWMVSYSTAVTLGPYLNGVLEPDLIVAAIPGGADLDATMILAERTDGGVPAKTITANGGMFGSEALAVNLAFNGWVVNACGLG